jgi:hypothetical protein
LPTRQVKLTAFRSAVLRKFWNCDQKQCILFSRAAKILIATKSTAFCSAAQRRF